MAWIETHWQHRSPLSLALLPLAGLYCAAVLMRRGLYQLGIIPIERLPVPVIVVGNITVGGTGKTPLVAWLGAWLAAQGYRPGIVSRGYGGRAREWPQRVTAHADPAEVGDEPVLLVRRTGLPLAVGPDRVAAARLLLDRHGCTVIISDDGLQHYRLGRDIEIAVIDGARRYGNGWCLPAGPLREPLARLREVDARVINGDAGAGELHMSLRPTGFHALNAAAAPARALTAFAGRTVHAVAGIGHPPRFFETLAGLGMDVRPHPFPDHHPYSRADLDFGDDLPVVMTEKDAVKCRACAPPDSWYLAVEADPDPALATRLHELLGALRRG